MKHMGTLTLAAVGLAAAAIFGTSAVALIAGGTAGQEGRVLIRLGDDMKPDGFEAQVRSGEVVGMTAIRRDGSRVALSQQQKPPCATSCLPGQKLTCWEDDAQMLSICVCGASNLRATREVILAGGS